MNIKTYEFDVVSDDAVDTTDGLELIVKDIKETSGVLNVEVVSLKGPAGGWPVIHVMVDADSIDAYQKLHGMYGDDSEDSLTRFEV